MTVDRGVVGGGDGYSAGGAGGNDSITLVVVARWREKRSKLAAESSGGDGDGGGSGRVVAVVLFLPRKGGRFLRDGLPSARRVGGSRSVRRAVWWGYGHHLCRRCHALASTSLPAREFVPRVALVLARRVSCVALFSSRTGRRHPTSSIGHGAGG